MEDDANKDNITLCGENLFCLFYSGRADDQSLNKLCFVTFCKKGSTSYNAISPNSLPPKKLILCQHPDSMQEYLPITYSTSIAK